MNDNKHFGCGGCGRLLIVVVPETPNGLLVIECPDWDESNPDEHTRITFDLKKTAEIETIPD